MSYSDLGVSYSDVPADRHVRAHPDRSRSTATQIGVTVFDCGPDEAVLFRQMGHRLGVSPDVTAAAVSETTAELARGNRCISVSHRTRIANSTLLALSRAGVEYISTRSIGCNHIDVTYAAGVGVSVGNVTYSPDSVADYTLMLMLMAVRHAKSVFRRADSHDYRLSDTRGKELRDLTVGVLGTGRIGTAVIDRLRGFGCRVLAHDSKSPASADHVPLDDLLRQSDIVTLHIPLDADTHHILDRHRLEQLKYGAYIVNTARGPLLDTEALLAALESGRVGGAALDVVEGEEGIFYADCRSRPVENKALVRLQQMSNVLISPHSAYYTDHAMSDTVENSLRNCLNFEEGSKA